MRVCSLFSGIGGFELGISWADPHLEVVFASEKDKHARKVYANHFGGSVLHGDIKQINASDVPDHDLLCGGFPCQDVSIAGKRAGLAGARTGLFFDLIRIVREKQPKCLLLENVKGLLSSNEGWDFARILIELADLGYFCEWQVLNTANFGCPQDRRRVFIVGYLATSGRSRSKVFPLRENEKIHNTSGEDQKEVYQISTCLMAGGSDKWNGTYLAHTLTGGGHSGGLHSDMDVIVHSHASRSGDPSKGGVGQLSKTDGNSYCLNTWNLQSVQVNSIFRRFTPIECERLMGFPDNWTAGISDTQRYKCLGNAVSPMPVKAIIENLMSVVIPS
ncbi:DNA (cytosine-5-)-methyltransferase [uncultured Methanomethylovorans sp.]|uniref:DNA (cytosine-5-)-methyltransferase n=1 Tax=uncultured Methanomethylovorans sp. TaxID=183759 RepID=UPI002AA63D7F|nr:DNA (cytosine-5-)-methyltransferase [uncultured Methanomethylovorans sp.]